VQVLVERIYFGIPLLDHLLYKGFPKDSLIVFSGPIGVGKSFLLKLMLLSRLSKNENIVIVSFDNDPLDVVSPLIKVNPGFVKQIAIVDGFGAGKELPKELSVVRLEEANVDYILAVIEQLIKEVHQCNVGMVAIDSMNELFLRMDPSLALNFVKSLKRMARKYELTITAVYHSGISGFEQIESLIYYVADGVIILDYDPKFEEIGLPLRRIRIVKLRDTGHHINWVPFQITDKGLEIVDVKSLLSKILKATREA